MQLHVYILLVCSTEVSAHLTTLLQQDFGSVFSGSPCPHIQTPFSPRGGHGQKARTVYLHFRTGIVA